MAFGTVTVRSESGEVQQYELTKPVSSVGRQPGNEIVLNTTAVSRYHAQFVVADGQVYLLDLGTVNGSFVNDVQIEPNSRVILNDGDRITLGDVMLIFHSARARRQLDIDLTPTASPVEAPDLPFRIVLDEPHQLVAPGARLQLVLVIESLADQELVLDVSTLGLSPGWVRLNRREVQLSPGEQTEVMLSVVPPRSSDTYPGRYPLTVRVALQDMPNRALEAVREIDVVGYSGLAMVAQESSGGAYSIAVQNQGNVPLVIDLDGFDPERVLAYQFDPAHLEIAPGETVYADLHVSQQRTPRNGDPVTFAIVAQSRDAAGFQAPVMARYAPAGTRTARGGWLGLVALFGGLALIALVLGGLLLLGVWSPFGGPSEPEVVAIAPSVTPSQVAPTPTLIEVPTQPVLPAVEIPVFTADQEVVTYRSDQQIVLKWQITGEFDPNNVTLSDTSGQLERNLSLTRADVRRGELRLPVYELEAGIHNFQLTVVDSSGAPIVHSLTGVTVKPTSCQVLDLETVVRVAPEDGAAEAVPPLILGGVVVAGRSFDSQWVWVAYNDPETLATRGWISAGEITCPPDVTLDSFVAVDASGDPLPPGFVPTATFAPVTTTPEAGSTPDTGTPAATLETGGTPEPASEATKTADELTSEPAQGGS